jgi:NAD(P)-dependent dehydrogenase (short-subunit alcohol dehydrogenase family)
MSAATSRRWIITGCSSGFGRLLALRALQRGDRVLVTSRELADIADIIDIHGDRASALSVDVTREGDAARAVACAVEIWGGVDVLVNNAAHGFLGAAEETQPEEYRALFDVNVFGLFEMTRAALPTLRLNPGSRIVNFSSVAGMSARPGFGYYAATKFAVEGFSEALAQELFEYQVAVIIVEPGTFRTEFLGRSIKRAKLTSDAYERSAGATKRASSARNGRQAGDPARAIDVLLKAVDSDNPPLRLALGPDAYERIRAKIKHVGADLDAWEHLGMDTSFRD